MQKAITIVLDRLRSAHNTGNIFRLAEAADAEIVGCGYTPLPPHPKLAKTAMGTDKTVPARHCASSLEAIRLLRSEGAKMILAVESGYDSREAYECEYDFPLVLVFGNEALGIDPATIAECDGVVSLPMFGAKSSINVGNSAAAVLYMILAKSKEKLKSSPAI